MKVLFLLLFIGFSPIAFGQADSCYTAMLHHRDYRVYIPKHDAPNFSRHGFYLMRNCTYDFVLKGKGEYSGRLLDIKPDTLYFGNLLPSSLFSRFYFIQDTIAVYYRQLEKIRLMSDHRFGFYDRYSLEKFVWHFEKDTTHCKINIETRPIFMNDTTSYELLPILTAAGVGFMYHDDGEFHPYQGRGMIKPDASLIDSVYRKKAFFSFIPCRVEEINGVAFGMYSRNLKNFTYLDRDTLTINGIAFEMDPLQLFFLITPIFNGPYVDSLDLYKTHLSKHWRVRVDGVNISWLNTVSEMKLSGVNLAPAFSLMFEMHGVNVCGINHFSYVMHGVSISGLRNRSAEVRGVQIGLYNRATDLRGFQFGLWNRNGKRALPLVNWQFGG